METDALFIADDGICPDGIVHPRSVEDAGPLAQGRHLADKGIVTIEDSRSLFIQGLDEFALGLGNVFLRSEQFDMALADVGDDTDGRFADSRQFSNLSKTAHAHFYDTCFMVRRQL